MHDLEKRMIEYGAIDTTIESIRIDDWFKNMTISYLGNEQAGNVVCNFENCFEISLNHDKTYSKEQKSDGTLDYKYFIQDVEIIEEDGFFIFKISAWPLDGKIVCRNISISTNK